MSCRLYFIIMSPIIRLARQRGLFWPSGASSAAAVSGCCCAAQPETRQTSRTEAAHSRRPLPDVKRVGFKVLSAEPTTLVLLFLRTCVFFIIYLYFLFYSGTSLSRPARAGLWERSLSMISNTSKLEHGRPPSVPPFLSVTA